MVALPQGFVTDEAITNTSNKVKVPDGEHLAVIINSGMEPSPYGSTKPQGLFLDVVITAGEGKDKTLHKHLAIADNTPFNQNNPEWTPSKAAYGELAQIAKAFGHAEIPAGFDTSNFHNKPIVIITKTKEGKDKDTGARKPEWDESFVAGFKASPAAGLPQALPSAATQPVQPAPMPAAPATNPFAAS